MFLKDKVRLYISRVLKQGSVFLLSSSSPSLLFSQCAELVTFKVIFLLGHDDDYFIIRATTF